MLVGRVLLRNERFELWINFFGSMEIRSSDLGRVFKIGSLERSCFWQMCDELERCGEKLTPENNLVASFFEEFCDAAIRPAGSVGWRAYFNHFSPEKVATAIRRHQSVQRMSLLDATKLRLAAYGRLMSNKKLGAKDAAVARKLHARQLALVRYIEKLKDH